MSDVAIRASFIPLVDAAPLIIAKYQGFDRRHGLSLSLHRSTSWAGLRDRLTAGLDQCAHMLAPIPVASQIGLGNPKAKMIVPCALSMNGNAISMSKDVVAAMQSEGWSPSQVRDPAAAASALAKVVRRREQNGRAPLTLASVYPISSHAYELRYWLAYAGLDPDKDVTLTIVPPPQMADAIEEGHIDGFCVGAPWNAVAAASGASRIIATKVDLFGQGPEKVLAVREDWANDNITTVHKLVRMIVDAASWCADPAHYSAIAQILSADEYLGLNAEFILSSLQGALFNTDENRVEDYLLFDPHRASYPRSDHALWFYAQMVRWAQIEPASATAESAKKAYRSDIYEASFQAHEQAGMPPVQPPGAADPEEPMRLFDGRVFDGDQLLGPSPGVVDLP